MTAYSILGMPSIKVPSLKIKGRQYNFNEVSESQMHKWLQECYAKFPIDLNASVVLMDFPWQYKSGQYKKDGARMDGLAAYPTMTLDEVKALPVKKTLNPKCAVAFMWITGPMIFHAGEVFKALGIRPSTVFQVWEKRYANGKPVLGVSHWSRSSTEFLVCGTIGSGWTRWRTSRSLPQEVATLRPLKHSEKPALFRHIIKDWLDVPGPRLELFCRADERDPDWWQWGLESSCGSHKYLCPPGKPKSSPTSQTPTADARETAKQMSLLGGSRETAVYGFIDIGPLHKMPTLDQ